MMRRRSGAFSGRGHTFEDHLSSEGNPAAPIPPNCVPRQKRKTLTPVTEKPREDTQSSPSFQKSSREASPTENILKHSRSCSPYLHAGRGQNGFNPGYTCSVSPQQLSPDPTLPVSTYGLPLKSNTLGSNSKTGNWKSPCDIDSDSGHYTKGSGSDIQSQTDACSSDVDTASRECGSESPGLMVNVEESLHPSRSLLAEKLQAYEQSLQDGGMPLADHFLNFTEVDLPRLEMYSVTIGGFKPGYFIKTMYVFEHITIYTWV